MKNFIKKTPGQWAWLVLAAGCGGDPVRPANVGTTNDVDVARSDSGNAVDVTVMDALSLDAASGDVTVVDIASAHDSATDLPGVDTPIVDAGSTLDATTVDTGSVVDSGVADTGTPLACGSGTHLCGGNCVSDTSVTSCGSSCMA